MPVPSLEPSSIEPLIEQLAAAGELDVAAEVLELWRPRSPSREIVVRLQVKLFLRAQADVSFDPRAIDDITPDYVDALVREGGWREAVALCRGLRRRYPDSSSWRERALGMERVMSPLPDSAEVPARLAVDEMVRRGEVSSALVAMRSLLQIDPQDRELADRVELLTGWLTEPMVTRSYAALSETGEAPQAPRSEPPPPPAPDPEAPTPLEGHLSVPPVAIPSPAQQTDEIRGAVRSGDLAGALARARALSQGAPEGSRWSRLVQALERLDAVRRQAVDGDDDEPTRRASTLDTVDLCIQRGELHDARDAARLVLQSAQGDVAASVSARLADLDLVLDSTLPTPVPPRMRSPEVSEPALPPRASMPDDPVAPPTATSSGDVMLRKRRIVRLE